MKIIKSLFAAGAVLAVTAAVVGVILAGRRTEPHPTTSGAASAATTVDYFTPVPLSAEPESPPKAPEVAPSSDVVSSTTSNDDFDSRILDFVRGWKFDTIENGSPIEVVYPMVFSGSA